MLLGPKKGTTSTTATTTMVVKFKKRKLEQNPGAGPVYL